MDEADFFPIGESSSTEVSETILPGEIIFTEIMYDPIPAVDLPEYEYIELYNRGRGAVNLEGFLLQAGNRNLVFPDIEMEPGTYLLVTHRDAREEYPGAGQVAGLFSSRTTLLNSGSSLILMDKDSLVIDFVRYTASMHSDEYYAGGGWSLERIDPDRECHSDANWTTCTGRWGGTPGRVNSVSGSIEDHVAPELLSAIIEGETELVLEFSESILPDQGTWTRSWRLVPGGAYVKDIRLNYPWNDSIRVSLFDPVEAGVESGLMTGDDLYDCAGNRYAEPRKIRFALPVLPVDREILISEVLFDPLPWCPRYIEIHNASGKVFSLDEVCLSARKGDQEDWEVSGRISGSPFLFYPGEFIALTDDPDRLADYFPVQDLQSVFRVKDLPPMDNRRGGIRVLDKYLNVLDEMSYDRDMHHVSIPDPEGIALERISFSSPSGSRSNWHSASTAHGSGTPGRENSQHLDPAAAVEGIALVNDLFSPNYPYSYLSIHYSFASPGYRLSLLVLDPWGSLVRQIAVSELPGREGFFTWDGRRDDGTVAGTGIYLILAVVSDPDGRIRKYRKTCILRD